MNDRPTSHLAIRFSQEDMLLIVRAAAASKMSISAFVIEAAVAHAKRILKNKSPPA